MKVSFNPNLTNYNSQRPAFTQPQKCKPQPAFTGKAPIALGTKVGAGISKKYDEFAEWLAKNFTAKFIDSKLMDKASERFKNTDNLFQHCLTVGSVVTSGLYMYNTMNNKKLDKDRRNVLTVNQGLTLVVSTAGAYGLDKFVNSWWENKTAQFIGTQLNDKKFYTDFVATNKAIAETNKTIKAQAKAAGKKPELKSMKKALGALYENPLYKNLTETAQSALNNKVKGMSALKSMIVFGFIYRYFVPVVVTKPANKICNAYLDRKHRKEAEAKKA